MGSFRCEMGCSERLFLPTLWAVLRPAGGGLRLTAEGRAHACSPGPRPIRVRAMEPGLEQVPRKECASVCRLVWAICAVEEGVQRTHLSRAVEQGGKQAGLLA